MASRLSKRASAGCSSIQYQSRRMGWFAFTDAKRRVGERRSLGECESRSETPGTAAKTEKCDY